MGSLPDGGLLFFAVSQLQIDDSRFVLYDVGSGNETNAQEESCMTHHLTILARKTHQALESFGTSGGWWAQNAGKWDQPCEQGGSCRERIAALLFDRERGIGLTGYRHNLGAGSADSGKGNYWNEYRRAQSFETAPGAYDWSKDAAAMWFLQEVTRLGCSEVVLFMCSPPESLTINGMAQLTPGTLSNIESTNYSAWAKYACDVTEHILSLGVPVRYLSPVNEPQWEWSSNNGQEGCHFEPEGFGAVYSAFLAELQRRPALAGVELAGPESGEWGGKTAAYISEMHADPLVRRHMSAVDCHSYWTTTETKQAFRRWADEHIPDRRLRMSEWCEMVHGTDPGMDSALVLAKCVQEDLTVLDVCHWCTWVGVSPRGYHDGLIHAWEEDAAVHILPLKRLWAYGNYSRFIRPGFRRVETQGAQALHPVAFCGAQGGQEQLIIVLINDQAAAKNCLLCDDCCAFSHMALHETSDAHDLAKTFSGPVRQQLTIPSRSVVTVVLSR